MSYTTLNRLCEPTHIYAPGEKGGFVTGAWWPDFGPMSYDYSEQYKMHPTSTIFKNHFSIPKERSDLMAKPMEEENRKQFRRDPCKEAILNSRTPAPYKSGGHMNPSKERHSYQGSIAKVAPVFDRETEAFNTMTRRSLSSPSLGGTTLPTSLVRLRDGSPSSPSSSLKSVDASRGSLPEWVAHNTIGARSFGSAGLAGSTMNKFCRTTPDTGVVHASLAAGSSTIRDAARSHHTVRVERWKELTRPGGGR
mmetsp:Transcript_41390/g.105386  ORF Transcript_41390/g.105386 Transcript_41390/m.105386 type:complete len:251 (-) Transcript_41390:57-809(-)